MFSEGERNESMGQRMDEDRLSLDTDGLWLDGSGHVTSSSVFLVAIRNKPPSLKPKELEQALLDAWHQALA